MTAMNHLTSSQMTTVPIAARQREPRQDYRQDRYQQQVDTGANADTNPNADFSLTADDVPSSTYASWVY